MSAWSFSPSRAFELATSAAASESDLEEQSWVVEDVQVELYLAVLVVEVVHVELRVVALVFDVVEVEELQGAVLGCSIERSDSSELLGPFVLTFDLLVAPVPDLVGVVPTGLFDLVDSGGLQWVPLADSVEPDELR